MTSSPSCDINWSFSRINTYVECPRAYKLHYLDKVPSVGNAFADWGTLCHSLFERYAKKELELYELKDTYIKEYADKVTHTFPPNNYTDLASKYYKRGIEVFTQYEGIPDGYEVVGVEQKLQVLVENRKLTGYIDLIIKGLRNRELVIMDYKSKAKFKSKTEQNHYAIQPYLYSNYVYEKYGEFPKLLIFDMFRAGEKITIPFVKKDFDAANKWLVDTTDKILSDTKYEPKCFPWEKEDDFYCKYLCDCRESCFE